MKNQYYRLDKIKKYGARYNLIFGERSNGKTFSVLEEILKNYVEKKEKGGIIRRWAEDLTQKRLKAAWDGIIESGTIEKYTNGKYTDIYVYAKQCYLCTYDDSGNRITDNEAFCYGFAITEMEHDKSTNYERITTILFDEFITRKGYLPDEFVLFMNVLSTIIRQRKNVVIYMLGNTVNKFCPYFKEMGITNIQKMKKNSIDVYTYGESELKVAVEYADSIKKKESNIYFAFNNPKLNMITKGEWELDIYPHCPIKYRPNEIAFIYFIKFEDIILQCEIVTKEDGTFTFIHRKTTELKEDGSIVFSLENTHKANYRKNITVMQDNLAKKIYQFFVKEKVFYQDNEVGDIVFNYLNCCK